MTQVFRVTKALSYRMFGFKFYNFNNHVKNTEHTFCIKAFSAINYIKYLHSKVVSQAQ